MKSLLIIVTLFFTVLTAGEGTQYGKALTLKEVTPLNTVVAQPESFIGKRILVEGTVTDVCKKRGCWIKIADDKQGVSLLVKVKDGEIVFPIESRGKKARVEGTIEKITFTMEQTRERHKSQCKLEGKEFDPKKVTRPDVIYRLKAFGAEIQ